MKPSAILRTVILALEAMQPDADDILRVHTSARDALVDALREVEDTAFPLTKE